MLTKSLKLRGHQNIDPIFVGVCGLCSAVLGLLKALLEKKIVINIESKEGKDPEVKMSHSRQRISQFDTSKFF
jgi:hypothetical protein